MARTLDKLLSSGANRAVQLRQSYDWTLAEQKELRDKIEAKKQKELDKFIVKANKKLSGAAYKACDKTEYANSVMEDKLQKYDVKHYLAHRKVNHTAVKAIFEAIKRGEGYTNHLLDMKKGNAALAESRASYVEKLKKQRDEFIFDYYHSLDMDAAKVIVKEFTSQKSGCHIKKLHEFNKKISSNDKAYIAKLRKQHDVLVAKALRDNEEQYKNLRKHLEDEYAAFAKGLDKKYSDYFNREEARLKTKLNRLESEIEAAKAGEGNAIKLPSDVLLSVKGLKMYFGGLKAVDDLTFDVKKGEIFGLIGPNGAGKTTVFNCITRFYDATDGEMYFENKYGDVVDLRDYKVHDIILQGIGRTFQNIELVKEISVLDNLLIASTRSYRSGLFAHALGLPMLKKEEKMLREKAMRILKFMGLESYAGWLAFGLPYGILKKVEIARALMADAKLIIMDEPAAGLNDSETADLTKTIRRIRDEFGLTILLVEHDMGLVMNVCDTVCAISFGQMLAMGTTEEIQKNKAVQEAYLGVEEDDE